MSRSILIWLLPAVALSAGGGCRAPLGRTTPEAKLVESGDYVLVTDLDVPSVRGPAGCGAQALATLLGHLDPTVDAQALADELPWQDQGANPVDLLLAARSRGFGATIAQGTWDDLVASVQDGRSPLVMFDAGLEVRFLFQWRSTTPVMHWGVVSGVASDGESVLFAAERHRHYVVDRDLFLHRWERSSNCLIHIDRPASAMSGGTAPTAPQRSLTTMSSR